jgi:hypothetical protein
VAIGRRLRPAAAGEGCRSKTFAPVKSSARCVDWQKVRVQELIGADQQQQGQVRAPGGWPLAAAGVLCSSGKQRRRSQVFALCLAAVSASSILLVICVVL